MRSIDQIYIDQQFVTAHGQELFDLLQPYRRNAPK